MFAFMPMLRRDQARGLKFTSNVPGEQADYILGQHTVLVPLWKAQVEGEDGKKKFVTKVKAGDVVVFTPKVTVEITNRVVFAQPNELLYTHGVPSFKQIYRHGEFVSTFVRWTCDEDLDLKKLDFLYEIYICDQHVR